MASVPSSVTNALIEFFKKLSECGALSTITATTNVYTGCGFAVAGEGWRDLFIGINKALANTGWCLLSPTDLDGCTSIAQIQANLTPRAAPGPVVAMKGRQKAKAKTKPKAKAKSKPSKKAKSGKSRRSTGRRP